MNGPVTWFVSTMLVLKLIKVFVMVREFADPYTDHLLHGFVICVNVALVVWAALLLSGVWK